ncbi:MULTISPECIES: hypothetical protein [Bacillales]|jgi:hypothetical protein|uniref:hypothetical protein n=1 Tax=Brevibacillus TaxID=55080 RepID=UPI00149225C4|nr:MULTISPECIES: hypothetical protein [Bacillales]NNV02291.1 hypothetical protein [Brevibacillus sp. MCWH]UFJ62793.1 hypothetical protein IRT44_08630 [Anoxybacillus sediminis]
MESSQKQLFQAEPAAVSMLKDMRETVQEICKKHARQKVRIEAMDGRVYEGKILDVDDFHVYVEIEENDEGPADVMGAVEPVSSRYPQKSRPQDGCPPRESAVSPYGTTGPNVSPYGMVSPYEMGPGVSPYGMVSPYEVGPNVSPYGMVSPYEMGPDVSPYGMVSPYEMGPNVSPYGMVSPYETGPAESPYGMVSPFESAGPSGKSEGMVSPYEQTAPFEQPAEMVSPYEAVSPYETAGPQGNVTLQNNINLYGNPYSQVSPYTDFSPYPYPSYPYFYPVPFGVFRVPVHKKKKRRCRRKVIPLALFTLLSISLI